MSAGLGGFLGLDPRIALTDPMRGLAAQAQQQPDQAMTLPPAAQAPAADPETTGAVPVGPPAAAPAAAPASGGGGGFGGILGSLFGGGGARAGDDQVDPNTGATVGQARQLNMQSLTKVGLLMLAAGQRMSSDQRAAIMAKMPDAFNNTDQLNNFAKMRLEMANARLAERKQAQAEQKSNYVRALLGGSGAATLPPASAGAPAGSGGGTGAAPAAGGGVAAPAMAGGAPAGAPAASGPTAGVTAGMSPGEVAAIGGMDDEKALETLAKRRGELDGAETFGTPFVDQQTGDKMVPIMKGGQQVRVQSIGHLTPTMTEEKDADGNAKRVTRVGGQVTNIADVAEDPQDKEERAASVGLRKSRYDALTKARPDVLAASAGYDKVDAAQKAVANGDTLAGFGADKKEAALNFLASTGMMTSAGLDYAKKKLVSTNDVNAILAQSGGEFAKQYYGPQISNSDVENAKKAVGGILSNSPDQVGAALGRIKDGYRKTIEQFDADAKSHNDRLSGIRSEGLRADLQVQPIGKDFSAQQQAPQQAAPAITPEHQAAARAELARRRAAQQGAR